MTRLPLVVICYCAMLVGCSSWPGKPKVPEYEQLRQSVEASAPVADNHDETTEGELVDDLADDRLEGKSVEKKDQGSGLLPRLGLGKKSRKDIRAAREHYANGDRLFNEATQLEGEERKKRFREAAREYEKAAENWRNSALEQDALLMAAESLFFAEDYYRADEKYAQLIKEYPRNPYLDHVDSRRFEIADFWLKARKAERKPFFLVNFTDDRFPLNDLEGHGKRVLEQLRLNNPTGKVSDDATMRLAMNLYEQGKWDEAAEAFSDLRISYPDSQHLFNAMFLEIICRLESYQGPRYSSVPVRKAQELIEKIQRQFPQEAQSRQQELKEAYARTRYLMAERIWVQAQYRKARQEYGSARFHYERLIDKYSDTPFAEMAKKELEAIQDKPADPPQRFKALIWLFRAEADDRPWRNENSNQGADVDAQ